jgi:chemotaxis regulatin CheY-phosphate phosphatase CheZ
MPSDDLARNEVLKDSEATLREVAGILTDLGANGSSALGELDEDGLSDPVRSLIESLPQVESLVGVVFRTYREIIGVIESIRNGRGILHRAAVERVQRTHQKLEEVSSVTETAASQMLDGLDRALSLVDEATTETDARAQLREELHGLISILQFQDITAQQLDYAAGVLKDVEDRLASLVELFEVHGLMGSDVRYDEAEEPRTHGGKAFDPAASAKGADDRQALADEIFTVP